MLQFSAAVRAAWAVLAAVLMTVLMTNSAALAQATAKGQTPAAAPAAAGAPNAGDQPRQSAWVKLCEKATLRKEDNKEEKLDICLTHHERLDGNTGNVIVSVALREIQGADRKVLMVMVPLGVAIPAGMALKIDEEQGLTKLPFMLCHPGGCTAEMEATPEFLGKLKKGKWLLVAAKNVAGKEIVLPVSLFGFETTMAGAPIDQQVYSAEREKLMKMIYERLQQEAQKRQDEAKAGGAPAAGATASAPAKK